MSEANREFAAALAHHQAGRTADAAAGYQKVLAAAPDHAEAHARLGNLRLVEGEAEDAIGHYREAIVHDPALVQAWSNLGAALYALDRPDEADAALSEAIARDGGNIEAYNNLGNLRLERGECEQAADLFQKAVHLDPTRARSWTNLGDALAGAGKLSDAISCYGESLGRDLNQADALRGLAGVVKKGGDPAAALGSVTPLHDDLPTDTETQFQLGTLYYFAGAPEAAIPCFERALETAPQVPEIHLNLGNSLHELKRYDEAIVANQNALDLRPDWGDAHNNLGNCHMAKGQTAEAVEPYRRARDADPSAADVARNLGNALFELGQLREAAAAFEDAIRLEPDLVGAHNGLANTYLKLGDSDWAIEHYRHALTLEPADGQLLHNLSLALLQTGDMEEALRVARTAVATNPELSAAHFALGRVFALQLNNEAAWSCYRRGLELEPDNIDGLMLHAAVHEQQWQPDQAVALYEQVLALRPDHTEALAFLVNGVLSLCDWSKYDAYRARLTKQLESDAGPDEAGRASIFNLQALPVSYEAIATAARASAADIVERTAAQRAACAFSHSRPPSRRLRIGYLLPYTSRHSLPEVLKTIVENHDRNRSEIFGYSTAPDPGSEFSRAYRAAFDHFTDIGWVSSASAARRVHADGIDVLFDVAGQTITNCLSILALKPAPMQVHGLGYSITTGADFIDYLLTDHIYMPDECARHGTEALNYMPHSFMTAPATETSAGAVTRREAGLPDEVIVFANFNHPCKFEPDVFSAWVRIMDEVPGSVLWLGDWIAATRENLRRAAADRGLDPERLIFAPYNRRAAHIARLRLADIALDTLYHGGGVTTLDALAAGLPVLTVRGETPASRLGATILTAAGLPDLVQDSLANYEERAISLARQSRELAALRARIEQAVPASPLFDTPRYTRHLERAFELMWENYLSGRPPESFDIPLIKD